MTETVAILSSCWTIVKVIEDVLNLTNEQTRSDEAQALKFLHKKALSFLEAVNLGLVGEDDTAPYIPAIKSFEGLLSDILKAAAAFFSVSQVDSDQLTGTDTRKPNLLGLNERLRIFFHTYTIQSATLARLNLPAFTQPLPQDDDETLEPIIPDGIQWAIMCHPDEMRDALDPMLDSSLPTSSTLLPPQYSEVIAPSNTAKLTEGSIDPPCPAHLALGKHNAGKYEPQEPPKIPASPIEDKQGQDSTGTKTEDEMPYWEAFLIVGCFPISVPALFCWYCGVEMCK